jgi:hypothetical protein
VEVGARSRGKRGGGKWQPPGPRPQLMLLVQPHPEARGGCCFFRVSGAGGGSEGGDEMSPRLGRALLQGFSPAPEAAAPAERLENSHWPHRSRPPGAPRSEGLGDKVEQPPFVCSAGSGLADLDRGRADFPAREARLGPPPRTHSFLVQASTLQGRPQRENKLLGRVTCCGGPHLIAQARGGGKLGGRAPACVQR